ncbi:MAG: hypothetical protein CME33_16920 [Gimesia sp.]|nr:hypothetical protein [Gimesia sp.]
MSDRGKTRENQTDHCHFTTMHDSHAGLSKTLQFDEKVSPCKYHTTHVYRKGTLPIFQDSREKRFFGIRLASFQKYALSLYHTFWKETECNLRDLHPV